MTRIKPGSIEILSADPPRAHLFSADEVEAIDAALDARRPLLLRGEPGCGKSQLAEAAAKALTRNFTARTVDALTEPADLLWTEDAVARLAEAQLAAVVDHKGAEAVRRRLKRKKFIQPGPLWWGFQWAAAAALAGCNKPAQPNGVVVLIDEIDKADGSVPNGLLEALGAGQFTPPGWEDPVRADPWPLVIITTNEERPLPNAFLRRCLVHHMDPPEGDEFIRWLVARAEATYRDAPKPAAILQKAAEAVAADRLKAKQDQLYPLPGLAEYLDLLRALFTSGDQDAAALTARMGRISGFFLKKNGVDP